jgi:copper chaperone CopZ
VNTLTLTINGMSCSHCLNAVQRALAAVPGLEIVSVRIGRADVRYDPALSNPDTIAAAVSDAGYEAAHVR